MLNWQKDFRSACDTEREVGVSFGVSVVICVASFTLEASENIPSKTYLYSLVRIEEIRNQGTLDHLFPIYYFLF